MADELVIDPATNYVYMTAEQIRFRTDTQEWRDAFNADLDVLVQRILEACPYDGKMNTNNGDTKVDVPNWSPALNNPTLIADATISWHDIVLTSVTTDPIHFDFTEETDNDGAYFTIRIYVGDGVLHYRVCKGANHLINWCIVRSQAGDVGLIFGRGADISSCKHPSDVHYESPVILKNNLVQYTPITLAIVNAIDSIENVAGFGGLIIPYTVNGRLPVTADNSEFEYKLNGTLMIGNVGSLYFDSPGGDEYSLKGGFYSPVLVTSDTKFYSRMFVGTGRSPDIAATNQGNYLVASYSPASRCVSGTAMVMEWGTTIDPHRIDDQYEHPGPDLVQLDQNYFLRSGGLFFPVQVANS